MITLYQHQNVMLSHLRMNRFFAIFAEQGTGKTLPLLMRMAELLKSAQARDALVVCPKAVIGSWYRDMEMFGEEDKALLQSRVTVINYDRVWRESSGLKDDWDIIVLDESHKIKSHTSKRSKKLLEMALLARYRYILTGTPISNGQLENIWSQFTFLDPMPGMRGRVYSRIFGGSFYQWLDRYAMLNQYHKPYRYVHVEELQKTINEHSYRVKKCECLDLPDKLPDEIYDIELPAATKKLYRTLMKESAIEELDVLAQNPLARMTRLRQMCSGWLEDTEVPCEKLTALEDFLEGYGDKKLAIFCEFRRSIDAVTGLLDRLKIPYVVLDGRQKDKTVWKQFQTDPKIRMIVCQYQSANAGIDLFAADTMLFFEPTLSSNVLEQTKDRIHRIGQSQKCSYIHFLTAGTVEKAIYRALRGYADFSEKLFSEYMAEYQKSFN